MSSSEATGVVFNIMRFAVHDGPGIRTTVFFKGCPLECWWCHNPESQCYGPEPMYFEDRCRHCGECVEICPEHAIEEVDGAPRTDLVRCSRCGACTETCAAGAREICGRRATVAEVIADVERDLVFFDESSGGVTLSGGEPLSQPRFALALLRACRERAIHATVETCGFAPAAVFQEIAREASLVLFDVKLLNRHLHRRYTGVFNDAILRNLEWLAASHRPAAVRIPVIPGLNDSAEDAREFACYLRSLGISRIHLLPYHRAGVEKYRRLGREVRWTCSPETVNGFADTLRDAGLMITIGR